MPHKDFSDLCFQCFFIRDVCSVAAETGITISSVLGVTNYSLQSCWNGNAKGFVLHLKPLGVSMVLGSLHSVEAFVFGTLEEKSMHIDVYCSVDPLSVTYMAMHQYNCVTRDHFTRWPNPWFCHVTEERIKFLLQRQCICHKHMYVVTGKLWILVGCKQLIIFISL